MKLKKFVIPSGIVFPSAIFCFDIMTKNMEDFLF